MTLLQPVIEGIFSKQIRFKVPVYQRHYVWKEEFQWEPLWDDLKNKVEARLKGEDIFLHYTGSIVIYSENNNTANINTYSVIDGQQRLTTFQLLITAFREVCRNKTGEQSLVDDLNTLLFNNKTYGQVDYDNQKFKFEPTKFNKETFKFILSNTYEDVDQKKIQPILDEKGVGQRTYREQAKKRDNILGAYIYFYDKMLSYIEQSEYDLEKIILAMMHSIKKDFQVVEIGLTHTDDPQMIFETMNGRGASLTETDLIRNFIFMRADLDSDVLNEVYDKYWDEFDDPATEYKWHEEVTRGRFKSTRLQMFMLDYLMMKLRSEVRYDQVFYQYKRFINNNDSVFSDITDELKELNKFSKTYKRITEPGSNNELEKLAKRLKAIDVTTIYPLLLAIEGDDEINLSDKRKLFKLLDSFITRRFVCGYTTKNYNNTFADFIKFLEKNKSFELFESYLKEKTADTNILPTNNYLKEKVKERPIYSDARGKSKAIINILLEVEMYNRGKKQESISFDDFNLTVEHILPQNWNDSWSMNGKKVSDEEFENAKYAVLAEEEADGIYHQIENRNRILNTFGNLTILTSSLNPSVSNGPFLDKKKEIVRQSTLVLNSYLQDYIAWDEESIEKRSDTIYQAISSIWKY